MVDKSGEDYHLAFGCKGIVYLWRSQLSASMKKRRGPSYRTVEKAEWFKKMQLQVSILMGVFFIIALFFLWQVLPAARTTLMIAAVLLIAILIITVYFTYVKFRMSEERLKGFIKLDVLTKINPFQVEHHVAHRFRKMGYHNVRVTKAKADGGIDVLMEKNGKRYGVQVKRYHPRKYIQVESVRALLGSMQQLGLDKVIYVTTSNYTNYVWKTINKSKIFLLNGAQFEKMSKELEKPEHTWDIAARVWKF